MPKSIKGTRVARRLAVWAHLYLGLGAGLLLVLVGLTGTLLVFHDEIDALLAPQLHRVAPHVQRATLDDVLSAARVHAAPHSPSFIRLPRHERQSVEIWTDGEAGPQVFVDPYNGQVLGSQMARESFTGWLFELHVELFAGEVGHIIIGVSALAMIVLLISGLVLWWPRAHRWMRALFSRPRGSWRRVNYKLHGMTGAWSAAGLLIIAITGASLVFHDEFSAALNSLTASAPPAPPPPSVVQPGAADAALELALANAESALPGGRFTWVYLPASPEAPLSLRKQLPGEWHPNGRSYVYVDRHTGEVIHAHDALGAELGTRIYDVLYPLHIGRFGLWSKLLYATLGVVPLFLSIGGTMIWWNRRVRRRRRAQDTVEANHITAAA
jgi:uncharacterized iron-regulated membrane protein